MYTRFFRPDYWVQRIVLPSFNSRKFELLRRSPSSPIQVQQMGQSMIIFSSSSDNWQPGPSQMLLQLLAEGDFCPAVLSTPREHLHTSQPFGAFDRHLRYLLQEFVPGECSRLPLQVNLAVPMELFGTDCDTAEQRLIDQVTDNHCRSGYMFAGCRTVFDPCEPHAVVSIERNVPEKTAMLRVSCVAFNKQHIEGLWNAVIRRLRPQYREKVWNWRVLETLMIDTGNTWSSSANLFDKGFFLHHPAPDWFDCQRTQGIGDWKPLQDARASYNFPRAHFADIAIPDWVKNRSFQVMKGPFHGQEGLWCRWV